MSTDEHDLGDVDRAVELYRNGNGSLDEVYEHLIPTIEHAVYRAVKVLNLDTNVQPWRKRNVGQDLMQDVKLIWWKWLQDGRLDAERHPGEVVTWILSTTKHLVRDRFFGNSVASADGIFDDLGRYQDLGRNARDTVFMDPTEQESFFQRIPMEKHPAAMYDPLESDGDWSGQVDNEDRDRVMQAAQETYERMSAIKRSLGIDVDTNFQHHITETLTKWKYFALGGNLNPVVSPILMV